MLWFNWWIILDCKDGLFFKFILFLLIIVILYIGVVLLGGEILFLLFVLFFFKVFNEIVVDIL